MRAAGRLPRAESAEAISQLGVGEGGSDDTMEQCAGLLIGEDPFRARLRLAELVTDQSAVDHRPTDRLLLLQRFLGDGRRLQAVLGGTANRVLTGAETVVVSHTS